MILAHIPIKHPTSLMCICMLLWASMVAFMLCLNIFISKGNLKQIMGESIRKINKECLVCCVDAGSWAAVCRKGYWFVCLCVCESEWVSEWDGDISYTCGFVQSDQCWPCFLSSCWFLSHTFRIVGANHQLCGSLPHWGEVETFLDLINRAVFKTDMLKHWCS